MATRGGWASLVLVLPEAIEDEVVGAVGAGVLGVGVEPSPGGRSVVRICLASPGEAERLLARLPALLASWDLDPAGCAARIEPIEDEPWVDRYQASLRPFPFGGRFVVVPDGRPHAEPGRTSIFLVPGRAFGTGEHPTTRLCAEALERWVAPGSRWLDLGCGSAILAVVAAHCGAGSIVARDDDPEAVEVAAGVLAANGLDGRVRLEEGSLDGIAPGALDGVVANIAAPFFLAHAEATAALLRPGGVVAASGFLREDVAEICAALARAGLGAVEEDESEGWGLVVAGRDGG